MPLPRAAIEPLASLLPPLQPAPSATPCPFQRVHAAASATIKPSAVSTALSPPCSLMSSGFSWASACANAYGRPLQTLLDALYASCGVTVR